ncbi:MAG: polysaccharide deacetylase family protein, partial [Atopostipes sp.]|nr:polysaccharide deacetylase family protein [Atopostipes sp.]
LSAIFFVNGMYMEEEEGFEVIQELHERGFEIGNHTHTHLNLGEQSEETQEKEILKTNEIIEEAIGEKPRFFRAPHGVMTDYTRSLLEDEGMTWMNWSFGYDWESEYQDADALTEVTLNSPYLNDGANILMHDREWTAEAVPEIIQGLEDQDYQMVDPQYIINHNKIEETDE